MNPNLKLIIDNSSITIGNQDIEQIKEEVVIAATPLEEPSRSSKGLVSGMKSKKTSLVVTARRSGASTSKKIKTPAPELKKYTQTSSFQVMSLEPSNSIEKMARESSINKFQKEI